MFKICMKLYTSPCLITSVSGSGGLVTTAMALAAQGQVFLCTSLGNNHHRLKACGGPKVKGLLLPPSSEDFFSCFSWPKDHNRRDADGRGGSRENSEVGMSWGEADVERERWEKQH